MFSSSHSRSSLHTNRRKSAEKGARATNETLHPRPRPTVPLQAIDSWHPTGLICARHQTKLPQPSVALDRLSRFGQFGRKRRDYTAQRAPAHGPTDLPIQPSLLVCPLRRPHTRFVARDPPCFATPRFPERSISPSAPAQPVDAPSLVAGPVYPQINSRPARVVSIALDTRQSFLTPSTGRSLPGRCRARFQDDAGREVRSHDAWTPVLCRRQSARRLTVHC